MLPFSAVIPLMVSCLLLRCTTRTMTKTMRQPTRCSSTNDDGAIVQVHCIKSVRNASNYLDHTLADTKEKGKEEKEDHRKLSMDELRITIAEASCKAEEAHSCIKDFEAEREMYGAFIRLSALPFLLVGLMLHRCCDRVPTYARSAP